MAFLYRHCFRPKGFELDDEIEHVYRTKIRVRDIGKQLNPGDAIGFVRKGYKHHAIVSEVIHRKRFKIIHLTSESKQVSSLSGGGKAYVTENTINFNKGVDIFKYTYAFNEHGNNENSLRIAQKFYKYGLPKEYHLFEFNCEHFVSYCVTGFPYSKQSDTANRNAKTILDSFIQKDDKELQWLAENKNGIIDQYFNSHKVRFTAESFLSGCLKISTKAHVEHDLTENDPLLKYRYTSCSYGTFDMFDAQPNEVISSNTHRFELYASSTEPLTDHKKGSIKSKFKRNRNQMISLKGRPDDNSNEIEESNCARNNNDVVQTENTSLKSLQKSTGKRKRNQKISLKGGSDDKINEIEESNCVRSKEDAVQTENNSLKSIQKAKTRIQSSYSVVLFRRRSYKQAIKTTRYCTTASSLDVCDKCKNDINFTKNDDVMGDITNDYRKTSLTTRVLQIRRETSL